METLPLGSSSYDLIKKFCWKTSPPCNNFPLNMSIVLSSCLGFHWRSFGFWSAAKMVWYYLKERVPINREFFFSNILLAWRPSYHSSPEALQSEPEISKHGQEQSLACFHYYLSCCFFWPNTLWNYSLEGRLVETPAWSVSRQPKTLAWRRRRRKYWDQYTLRC
jgi:hypothetical protein